MNKKLYKILVACFVIVITMLLNNVVNAATMSVAINKSTATVGDTFSVTISGIYGRVEVSGNSNIKLSQSGSVFVDGSLTISGTAQTAGTGTVTVTAVDAVTSGATPEEVSGSQSKSITIKEKVTTTNTTTNNQTSQSTTKKNTTTSTKTNTTTTTTKKTENKVAETKEKEEATLKWGINSVKLIGIKENGEKIDLELDKKFNINTYEYSCNVSSDIKKIEVQKEAYDYNEYVTITGLEQDLKDGENSIILKLAKEGQKELKYTFKVNKEAKQEEVQLSDMGIEAEVEETKTNAQITLPIWQFILIELATIVISIGVTIFVMKKFFKKKK